MSILQNFNEQNQPDSGLNIPPAPPRRPVEQRSTTARTNTPYVPGTAPNASYRMPGTFRFQQDFSGAYPREVPQPTFEGMQSPSQIAEQVYQPMFDRTMRHLDGVRERGVETELLGTSLPSLYQGGTSFDDAYDDGVSQWAEVNRRTDKRVPINGVPPAAPVDPTGFNPNSMTMAETGFPVFSRRIQQRQPGFDARDVLNPLSFLRGGQYGQMGNTPILSPLLYGLNSVGSALVGAPLDVSALGFSSLNAGYEGLLTPTGASNPLQESFNRVRNTWERFGSNLRQIYPNNVPFFVQPFMGRSLGASDDPNEDNFRTGVEVTDLMGRSSIQRFGVNPLADGMARIWGLSPDNEEVYNDVAGTVNSRLADSVVNTYDTISRAVLQPSLQSVGNALRIVADPTAATRAVLDSASTGAERRYVGSRIAGLGVDLLTPDPTDVADLLTLAGRAARAISPTLAARLGVPEPPPLETVVPGGAIVLRQPEPTPRPDGTPINVTPVQEPSRGRTGSVVTPVPWNHIPDPWEGRPEVVFQRTPQAQLPGQGVAGLLPAAPTNWRFYQPPQTDNIGRATIEQPALTGTEPIALLPGVEPNWRWYVPEQRTTRRGRPVDDVGTATLEVTPTPVTIPVGATVGKQDGVLMLPAGADELPLPPSVARAAQEPAITFNPPASPVGMERTLDELASNDVPSVEVLAPNVVRITSDTPEAQRVLDEAVDLSPLYGTYSTRDWLRLVRETTEVPGARISGKLRPDGTFVRNAASIHRVASLFPDPYDATRPLVPPLKADVVRFEETYGVPHPYAAYAVSKPRTLGISTRPETLARINEYEALAKLKRKGELTPEQTARYDKLRNGVSRNTPLVELASLYEAPIYRNLLHPTMPAPSDDFIAALERGSISDEGIRIRLDDNTIAQVSTKVEQPTVVDASALRLQYLQERGKDPNLSDVVMPDNANMLWDGVAPNPVVKSYLDSSFAAKARAKLLDGDADLQANDAARLASALEKVSSSDNVKYLEGVLRRSNLELPANKAKLEAAINDKVVQLLDGVETRGTRTLNDAELDARANAMQDLFRRADELAVEQGELQDQLAALDEAIIDSAERLDELQNRDYFSTPIKRLVADVVPTLRLDGTRYATSLVSDADAIAESSKVSAGAGAIIASSNLQMAEAISNANFQGTENVTYNKLAKLLNYTQTLRSLPEGSELRERALNVLNYRIRRAFDVASPETLAKLVKEEYYTEQALTDIGLRGAPNTPVSVETAARRLVANEKEVLQRWGLSNYEDVQTISQHLKAGHSFSVAVVAAKSKIQLPSRPLTDVMTDLKALLTKVGRNLPDDFEQRLEADVFSMLSTQQALPSVRLQHNPNTPIPDVFTYRFGATQFIVPQTLNDEGLDFIRARLVLHHLGLAPQLPQEHVIAYLPSALHSRLRGEPDFKVNGSAIANEYIISHFTDASDRMFATPLYSAIHEEGHVLSNIAEGGRGGTLSRWNEATGNTKPRITEYAYANADEDFAESYAYARLRNAYPNPPRPQTDVPIRRRTTLDEFAATYNRNLANGNYVELENTLAHQYVKMRDQVIQALERNQLNQTELGTQLARAYTELEQLDARKVYQANVNKQVQNVATMERTAQTIENSTSGGCI